MKSFRQFLYENVTSDLQDLAMNAQGSVADIASTHGKGLIGSLGKQIGVLGKLTDLNTAIIGGVVETGLQKLAGVGTLAASAATIPLFINQSAGEGSEIRISDQEAEERRAETQKSLKDFQDRQQKNNAQDLQSSIDRIDQTSRYVTTDGIKSPNPEAKTADTSKLSLANRNSKMGISK